MNIIAEYLRWLNATCFKNDAVKISEASAQKVEKGKDIALDTKCNSRIPKGLPQNDRSFTSSIKEAGLEKIISAFTMIYNTRSSCRTEWQLNGSIRLATNARWKNNHVFWKNPNDFACIKVSFGHLCNSVVLWVMIRFMPFHKVNCNRFQMIICLARLDNHRNETKNRLGDKRGLKSFIIRCGHR